MTTLNTFTEESMKRVAREIFARERESMMAQFRAENQALAPEYGVHFKNASGETIPPYAVMEISHPMVKTPSGYDCISVTKPTTKRDFKMWLVNGPQFVGTGGYGRGSWAMTPCRVMVADTLDVTGMTTSFAPRDGTWWLTADQETSTGGLMAGGFGFRWALPGIAGTGAFGSGSDDSEFRYDYGSGETNLRCAYVRQEFEPNIPFRKFYLTGQSSTGWTNTTDQIIPSGGGLAYLRATTTTLAGYDQASQRLGVKTDGNSTPSSSGTFQFERDGYYRFDLVITFKITGNTFSTSWPTGSGTTASGGSPSHDHTYTYKVYDRLAYGPKIEVFYSSASVYKEHFASSGENSFSADREYTRTITWFDAALANTTRYIALALTNQSNDAHVVKLTTISSTNAPATCYVTRISNAEFVN